MATSTPKFNPGLLRPFLATFAPIFWLALPAIVFTGCSRPGLVAPAAGQTRLGTEEFSPGAPGWRKPIPLIAGTYTGENSQGVYGFSYDPVQHAFGRATLLASLENPSFGAFDKDHRQLYLVEEVGQGQLVSLSRDGDTSPFVVADRQATRGAHPCYLALSPNRQSLAVANYSTGNIAIFRLDPTGALMGEPTVRQHSGRGPNAARQEGPHAHWVQWAPEGDYLYAVDLGVDRVFGYPIDPVSGAPGDRFTALATDPGAGPRHMVFHPGGDLVYIVNELANQVVTGKRLADGTLAALSQTSTLPEDFDAPSQAAHITINSTGTRLYVSNRGHDSIAVFAVDPDGSLKLQQHAPSQGHWPRFFLLLEEENLLMVANEKSGNISVFSVDSRGSLTPLGQPLSLSQPTFLGKLF